MSNFLRGGLARIVPKETNRFVELDVERVKKEIRMADTIDSLNELLVQQGAKIAALEEHMAIAEHANPRLQEVAEKIKGHSQRLDDLLLKHFPVAT